MTNFKRINEIDRKELKIFKKVLIMTVIILAITLSVTIYLSVIYNDFRIVLVALLGFIAREYFNTYIHNYKELSKQIDKL